jgi:hypothetical protein
MEPPRKYCAILIKRRVSGDPGPPPMLLPGELAVNEVDNVLYTGSSSESLSGDIVTDLGAF